MSVQQESKNKIQELVNQFQSASKNRDFINEQNEEWVKWNYLEPLFEALGWKRSEIVKEQRVLKGRADYILKIGNEEVLVVEAKKVGVNLTEDEGRQAVSYAYHRKIKFAVLTNFKEIRVYHALSNIKNIDKNILKFGDGTLFRINYEQLLENIDKLELLSRESFEKQEINKLLSKKDEKTAKPIDESILFDLLHIRELLSKDLKKLRMQLTQSQIDEAVQVLINRLIFMRSVEDRGLENANFLLGLVKDFNEGRLRKRFWDELIVQFKTFDKTYNSKLFAHSILEDENIFFDDDSLTKTIRILYFGSQDIQARYMFDEIPGDLLGSIYEQYLGTVLQETEKRVKLDSESGKRKKMGIYYTPSYIVDYIVKNTVGEYIKDKTIDEILEVNIVDPACGSGSFLLRAFQEVCNTIEERLKKGEKAKTSTFTFYNNNRLSLSQKISILTNCIYGVDLDEKAVELAQLNLLLRLLEDESKDAHKHILPNLRENIKCGNSLIDDPKVAGDKAFNWNAQFSDVFRRGGFDVVVGNPPYFKVKESNPIKKLEVYNEIKSGMMNISAIFINKALEITKKEGFIGMIVPKMLAFTDSWEKIRRKILLNTSLYNVVDAGKAFEDVLLEQIIFCLHNKITKDNLVKIGSINKGSIVEKTLIKQELCFKDNKIYLEPEKIAYFIKEKMEKSNINLGDISEIFLGLGIQGMDNFVDSPKKDYKKALGGNDIQRWRIRGYWYYNSDDKEFKKYKNQMEKFYRPKIVAQRIVAHIKDHIKITAAFDKEGLFTFNTVTNFIINDERYGSEFILMLLNSKIIQYYAYKFIYQNAIRSMDFYEVYAKQIPIPEITKSQEQKIIGLVDTMLSLQKQLHEGKPSGNEKERLEQQIKNTDYEIDQEVYKLYGLTKEEVKIVEDSLK